MLVLAPWLPLWDRNYFAALLPPLGDWMASGFVRGGVTGVGLVTTTTGLRDLIAVFLSRRDDGDAAAGGPGP